MKKYYVVTPLFSYTEWVCPEGGPSYDVCDVIEIEADNSRDAVALGVKEMLANHRNYQYCRDQRSSDECPYTGVRAEEVEEEMTGEETQDRH